VCYISVDACGVQQQKTKSIMPGTRGPPTVPAAPAGSVTGGKQIQRGELEGRKVKLIEHAHTQDLNFQAAKAALETVKRDMAAEGENITHDRVSDLGPNVKKVLQVAHGKLETSLHEVNLKFKSLYDEQQKITKDSKEILVWIETYAVDDSRNKDINHNKALSDRDKLHKGAIDSQNDAHNAQIMKAERDSASRSDVKVQVNEAFLKEVEIFVQEVNAILQNKAEYTRIFEKMSTETNTIQTHIKKFRDGNTATESKRLSGG